MLSQNRLRERGRSSSLVCMPFEQTATAAWLP